jgi:hypothetical protein
VNNPFITRGIQEKIKYGRRFVKMTDNNIDFGNMKSRDVGNLISKTLVQLGKQEVSKNAGPNDDVDYGNLPSKALPELGKQIIKNEMNL